MYVTRATAGAVLMLGLASATFADVVPATLIHDFSTGDTAVNGVTDGVGDYKYNPPTGATQVGVGEHDVAGTGNQYLARLILRFALPTVPANMAIQSATLNLTPANITDANGLLGSKLQLWHSTSDNFISSTPGDPLNGYRNGVYNDTTYSDSGITVLNGSAIPPIGTNLALNVTSLIQDDYTFDTQGAAVASFRVQLPANYVATWDTVSSAFILFAGDGSSATSQRPSLTVTFVPVPEAATLPALAATICLLSLRKR